MDNQSSERGPRSITTSITRIGYKGRIVCHPLFWQQFHKHEPRHQPNVHLCPTAPRRSYSKFPSTLHLILSCDYLQRRASSFKGRSEQSPMKRLFTQLCAVYKKISRRHGCMEAHILWYNCSHQTATYQCLPQYGAFSISAHRKTATSGTHVGNIHVTLW